VQEKVIALGKTYSFRLSHILWIASFAVPFLISGPQLLTGTFVNLILIFAASRYSGKNLLPVIFLPSIAAVSHGVVFGPLTPFLIYFLPFIWVGNAILVGIFKINTIKSSYVRILLGSMLKAGFLFAAASIYFKFHLVPPLFITSMGLIQLITALLGGIFALVILKTLITNERG